MMLISQDKRRPAYTGCRLADAGEEANGHKSAAARRGPDSPPYIIEVYLGKGDPILSHTHEHGPAPQAQTPQAIPGVQSIIAVGSGKGGVGKTTLSVNLAIALARMGHKVGLLDADVYGPNVPLMFGTNEAPQIAAGDRIVPIERYGVRVISVGFLNPGDKPLVWRGPMLHSIIRQFLGQVEWGELDYLVVDLPPGTGDVAISLIQTVPLSGAIVVTTPSDVALQDARKAIEILVRDRFAERSDELGRYFMDRLRTIRSPHVDHVRGKGLLIGVVLKPEAGGARRFCEALMGQGLLCKETHEHVIRFAPPITITRDEIDWARERIQKVLG